MDQLRRSRFSKVAANLKRLAGPVLVKLNNFGASECNAVRLFAGGALDRFQVGTGTPHVSFLCRFALVPMLPPGWHSFCWAGRSCSCGAYLFQAWVGRSCMWGGRRGGR